MKSRALIAILFIATTLSATTREKPTIFAERLREASEPLTYYDRSGEGIRLYYAKKYTEAEKALDESLKMYPEDGLLWLYQGLVKLTLRKNDEAEQAMLKAHTLTTEVAGWYPTFVLCHIYAFKSDKESTYRWLEKLLYEDRYAHRQNLYTNAAFAFIKEEPRFQKLTAQVETAKMPHAEGWRNDLEMLVEEIKRVNHLYNDRELPKDFLARYNKLKNEIPTLTNDQVIAGIAHMVATLNQGHTGVFINPNSISPARSLPLLLQAFPEGIFVTKTLGEHEDLVGCELLEIEGQPVGEVLRRVEQHMSVENKMLAFTVGLMQMRNLQMLRGLGIVKAGEEIVGLKFRKRSGEVFERKLQTSPRDLSQRFAPGDVVEKFGLPPGVPRPMFLRNTGREHWFEKLSDGSIYVQFNQVANAPDETLEAFGLRLRKELAEGKAKNVIVDVRHNNGGTTALYKELLRTLIAHTTIDGNRLYVIIGRGVYSACSNFITDLERLARPTFVGEPSSGTGNQDGDNAYFILPYSKVATMISAAWWQLSTPWDKRHSLVPDIPVQLTAKAFFEGRDPCLEVILQDIRRPARPDIPEFP